MGLKGVVKQGMGLGEMASKKEGGVINWFPGHMAAATRVIRQGLKLSDLVIGVRDARLLELVEFKLKEVISREPTLLVTVVGVPNVGKSTSVNSIHQIALSHFRVKLAGEHEASHCGSIDWCYSRYCWIQDQELRFSSQIAHQPSICVIETPGILVPSIPNLEKVLRLALAGSVKDSVVGW
ncbi:hypothetical protein SLEP1_g3909 [Rubroshorea leprosula]|uniref:G domain-containing protein n=1 Tax=Rubroshorea leprosula TaxID=152421 RepID=A0AAV5HVU3_9ROSI|nr:hypothetical protein SLEP1_g3909 [Rubroshorea leprosula]